MKFSAMSLLVLLICCLASLSFTQAQDKESSCDSHPELLPKLLKDDRGKPVRLSYEKLKERATNCETAKLPGMVDAKGQVLVQVLVGPSGAVACAKAISGHPLVRVPAQEAAKKWTFKPLTEKGEKVAFMGILVIYVSWDYEEAKKKQCGKG